MIDLFFAILIAGAAIKGYQKGLIIAIFSIIAFIIGLAAAVKLSAAVAVYLQHSVNVPNKWLPFISFILIFLLVVFLVNRCGKFIEKTFQAVLLGWANRLAGIIFYVALYSIIFSVFLFYAEKIHLLQTASIQSSQCYPYVQPLGPKLIGGAGKIIPVFKDMFTQLDNFFSAIPDKIPH